MIRVEGLLVANAEYRLNAEGQAVVVARVQTGSGFPFEAPVNFGSGPSLQIKAHDFARTLRRGDRVIASGQACRPRTDHSHAAIVLMDNVEIQKCE